MVKPAAPPLAGFACLVLAHDNPAQLLLLLRWLGEHGAQCHLHLDPRATELRAAVERAALPGVALLPAAQSRRIEWGGFAMVGATLALLRAALSAPGVEQLCLLSGTHLPLLPAAALAARLGDGRNHLDLRFACMEPPDRESLHRFWFRGVPGRQETRPLVRWLNRHAWRLGPRDLARGLRGLTPMVGSQWWHLTAAAARDMLAFLTANPWYEAFFRHARIPDESFFQTLLGATPHVATLGTPMSFQCMRGYSPAVLAPADLAAAHASGAVFARKFDLRWQPESTRLALQAAEAEEALMRDGKNADPYESSSARSRDTNPARPVSAVPDDLPDGLAWLGAPPQPRPGEVIALLVTRNEALRLPACLAHLRGQGVDRAYVIDNRSSDATREIAARHPWVHVMDAPGSYAASGFGISWTNAVLDRHARGHWVLVVDADELLVYPGCETQGLPALCAHLQGIGAEALRTILLDCFPDGPLHRLGYAPGDPLPEAAPCFEPPRLRAEPIPNFPYDQEYGGVRERLFFAETDPAMLRRRLHQKAWNAGVKLGVSARLARFVPRRSPTVTKLPLVFWRAGAALLASTHQLAPMRLVAGQPSGVLLHYKFLQDFHERALDAVRRDAHWDGSREYRRYLAALARDPEFGLQGPLSLRYEGPDQLTALGLMRDSPAWMQQRRLAAA